MARKELNIEKEVKSSANNVVSLFKIIATGEKGGRIETFEQAMERMNLNENDIVEVYNQNKIMTYVFSAFLFMNVMYFLNGLILGFTMTTVSSIGIGAFMASLTLKYSFNCYKIRNRKLVDFSVFLKEPKEWIP